MRKNVHIHVHDSARGPDDLTALKKNGASAAEIDKVQRKNANDSADKPTIYEALKKKLGREPTNQELKADVQRILREGSVEMAEKGKLPHQRRR